MIGVGARLDMAPRMAAGRCQNPQARRLRYVAQPSRLRVRGASPAPRRFRLFLHLAAVSRCGLGPSPRLMKANVNRNRAK